MSCQVLPGLKIFIGRKRQNQNISYIQDFTVDQYQQCLSWKVRSIRKWSNKNFLRDNSTRRCNWDVFFRKKVLFFSRRWHFCKATNWWKNSFSSQIFCVWKEHLCFLKFENWTFSSGEMFALVKELLLLALWCLSNWCQQL